MECLYVTLKLSQDTLLISQDLKNAVCICDT